jgi:hypothetical protein
MSSCPINTSRTFSVIARAKGETIATTSFHDAEAKGEKHSLAPFAEDIVNNFFFNTVNEKDVNVFKSIEELKKSGNSIVSSKIKEEFPNLDLSVVDPIINLYITNEGNFNNLIDAISKNTEFDIVSDHNNILYFAEVFLGYDRNGFIDSFDKLSKGNLFYSELNAAIGIYNDFIQWTKTGESGLGNDTFYNAFKSFKDNFKDKKDLIKFEETIKNSFTIANENGVSYIRRPISDSLMSAYVDSASTILIDEFGLNSEVAKSNKKGLEEDFLDLFSGHEEGNSLFDKMVSYVKENYTDQYKDNLIALLQQEDKFKTLLKANLKEKGVVFREEEKEPDITSNTSSVGVEVFEDKNNDPKEDEVSTEEEGDDEESYDNKVHNLEASNTVSQINSVDASVKSFLSSIFERDIEGNIVIDKRTGLPKTHSFKVMWKTLNSILESTSNKVSSREVDGEVEYTIVTRYADMVATLKRYAKIKPELNQIVGLLEKEGSTKAEKEYLEMFKASFFNAFANVKSNMYDASTEDVKVGSGQSQTIVQSRIFSETSLSSIEEKINELAMAFTGLRKKLFRDIVYSGLMNPRPDATKEKFRQSLIRTINLDPKAKGILERLLRYGEGTHTDSIEEKDTFVVPSELAYLNSVYARSLVDGAGLKLAQNSLVNTIYELLSQGKKDSLSKEAIAFFFEEYGKTPDETVRLFTLITAYVNNCYNKAGSQHHGKDLLYNAVATRTETVLKNTFYVISPIDAMLKISQIQDIISGSLHEENTIGAEGKNVYSINKEASSNRFISDVKNGANKRKPGGNILNLYGRISEDAFSSAYKGGMSFFQKVLSFSQIIKTRGEEKNKHTSENTITEDVSIYYKEQINALRSPVFNGKFDVNGNPTGSIIYPLRMLQPADAGIERFYSVSLTEYVDYRRKNPGSNIRAFASEFIKTEIIKFLEAEIEAYKAYEAAKNMPFTKFIGIKHYDKKYKNSSILDLDFSSQEEVNAIFDSKDGKHVFNKSNSAILDKVVNDIIDSAVKEMREEMFDFGSLASRNMSGMVAFEAVTLIDTALNMRQFNANAIHPGFFKSAVEIVKRYKALVSPSKESYIFNKPTFKIAVLNDIERDSGGLYSFLVKTAVESKLMSEAEAKALYNPYLKNNEADAQGFVTLDRYVDFRRSQGDWDESNNTLVEKLKDKNHVPTFYEKQQALNLFGPQKPFHYSISSRTTNINEDGTASLNHLLAVPTMLKYSMIPIIPAIHKGTELASLLENMEKNGIDEVLFDSAVKMGSQGAIDFSEAINGKDLFAIELENRYHGMQQVTPNKITEGKSLRSIGIQFKKLMKNVKSGLVYYTKNGVEYTGEKYLEETDAIEAAITERLTYEFMNNLGLDFDSGNIKDVKKFNEGIKRKLLKVDAIKNNKELVDFIKEKTSSEITPFNLDEVGPSSYQIISSVISSFQKGVVNPSMPGGSAVQVSPVGLNSMSEEEKSSIMFLDGRTSAKLMHPLPGKAGECLVPLSFFKNIPGLEKMSYEEITDLMKNNKDVFNKAIGYRIPTQKLSSIDSLDIVGILPPHLGDSIILYPSITGKTGSDYDIDKMFLIFKSIKVYKNKQGKFVIRNSNQSDGSSAGVISQMHDELFNHWYNMLNSSNTEAYLDKMAPVDASELKDDYTKDILELQGRDLDAINNKSFLDIMNPITQLRSKSDNMGGQDGIGATANQQNMAAVEIGYGYQNPILSMIASKFNVSQDQGNAKTEVLSYARERVKNTAVSIVDAISSFLNGFVDMAKDPFLSYVNINKTTSGMLFAMIRAGVHPMRAMLYLNHPVIFAYSKYGENGMIQYLTSKGIDFSGNDLAAFSKAAEYNFKMKKFKYVKVDVSADSLAKDIKDFNSGSMTTINMSYIISMLKMYHELNSLSSELSTQATELKFDKLSQRSSFELRNRLYKNNANMSKNYLSNNTYLGSLRNSFAKLSVLLNSISIVSNETVTTYISTILNDTSKENIANRKKFYSAIKSIGGLINVEKEMASYVYNKFFASKVFSDSNKNNRMIEDFVAVIEGNVNTDNKVIQVIKKNYEKNREKERTRRQVQNVYRLIAISKTGGEASKEARAAILASNNLEDLTPADKFKLALKFNRGEIHSDLSNEISESFDDAPMPIKIGVLLNYFMTGRTPVSGSSNVIPVTIKFLNRIGYSTALDLAGKMIEESPIFFADQFIDNIILKNQSGSVQDEYQDYYNKMSEFDKIDDEKRTARKIGLLEAKLGANQVIIDPNMKAWGSVTYVDGLPVVKLRSREYLSRDTVIHELSHVFIDISGGAYTSEAMAAYDQAMQTDIADRVSDRYPELKEGSELHRKEVLAVALGLKGTEIFENAEESIFGKIRNWVNKVYNIIKKKLGLDYDAIALMANEVLNSSIYNNMPTINIDEVMENRFNFKSDGPMREAKERYEGSDNAGNFEYNYKKEALDIATNTLIASIRDDENVDLEGFMDGLNKMLSEAVSAASKSGIDTSSGSQNINKMVETIDQIRSEIGKASDFYVLRQLVEMAMDVYNDSIVITDLISSITRDPLRQILDDVDIDGTNPGKMTLEQFYAQHANQQERWDELTQIKKAISILGVFNLISKQISPKLEFASKGSTEDVEIANLSVHVGDIFASLKRFKNIQASLDGGIPDTALQSKIDSELATIKEEYRKIVGIVKRLSGDNSTTKNIEDTLTLPDNPSYAELSDLINKTIGLDAGVIDFEGTKTNVETSEENMTSLENIINRLLAKRYHKQTLNDLSEALRSIERKISEANSSLEKSSKKVLAFTLAFEDRGHINVRMMQARDLFRKIKGGIGSFKDKAVRDNLINIGVQAFQKNKEKWLYERYNTIYKRLSEDERDISSLVLAFCDKKMINDSIITPFVAYLEKAKDNVRIKYQEEFRGKDNLASMYRDYVNKNGWNKTLGVNYEEVNEKFFYVQRVNDEDRLCLVSEYDWMRLEAERQRYIAIGMENYKKALEEYDLKAKQINDRFESGEYDKAQYREYMDLNEQQKKTIKSTYYVGKQIDIFKKENYEKDAKKTDGKGRLIPLPKYKSAKWAALTTEEKKIADGFEILLHKSNGYLEKGDMLINNELPFVGKTSHELYAEGKLKEGFKEGINESIKNQQSKDLDYVNDAEERASNEEAIVRRSTFNGEPIQRPPVKFRDKGIKIEDRSKDILSILMMNYHSAINFEEMSKAAFMGETLKALLREQNINIKEGGKKVITKYFNKAFNTKGNSQRLKAAESVFDEYVLGKRREDMQFGKGYSISKILGTITSISAKAKLNGNIEGGLVNATAGTVSSMIAFKANNLLDSNLIGEASTEYFKNIVDSMKNYSADDAMRTDKLTAITVFFNSRLNFNEAFVQDIMNDKTVRAFFGAAGHMPFAVGEHMISTVLTIAKLKGIRCIAENGEYLKADGTTTPEISEAVSLYDSIIFDEKSRRISISPKVFATTSNFTSRIMRNDKGEIDERSYNNMVSEIGLNISDLISNTQGYYGNRGLSEMDKKVAGPALMSLRKFLPRKMMMTFAGWQYALKDFDTLYNPETGEYDEDLINGNAFGDEAIMGMVTAEIIQIMEGYRKTEGSTAEKVLGGVKAAVGKNDDKVSEIIAYNASRLRWTGIFAGSFYGLYLLSSLVAPGGDDEEGGFIENIRFLSPYIALRVFNELTYFANPGELLRSFNNVSQSFGFISDLAKLAGDLFTGDIDKLPKDLGRIVSHDNYVRLFMDGHLKNKINGLENGNY